MVGSFQDFRLENLTGFEFGKFLEVRRSSRRGCRSGLEPDKNAPLIRRIDNTVEL